MYLQSLILFDGICNLCNSAVNFVIKHDKHNQFLFAPLQSAHAKQILTDYKFYDKMNSFILVENGKLYTSSSAALRVAKKLNGLWPLIYGFIIVPKFIRDGIYKFISRKRYKWFGKKDACMMPTAELEAKFLS